MKASRLRVPRPLAWTAALIAVALPAPPGTAAQVKAKNPQRSQAEIARDLRGGDRDRMKRAVNELPRVEADRRSRLKFPDGFTASRELADALIFALDREARLHLDGWTSTAPLCPGCVEDETILVLGDQVLALRDPAAIPALVQILPIATDARIALLEFGPRSVPAMVKWARDPEATGYDVDAALVTLASGVSLWGEDLPAAARRSIEAAAMMHIEGPPERHASSKGRDRIRALHGAMALASVLAKSDPELKAFLQAIAADEGDARSGEARRRLETPYVGIEGNAHWDVRWPAGAVSKRPNPGAP